MLETLKMAFEGGQGFAHWLVNNRRRSVFKATLRPVNWNGTAYLKTMLNRAFKIVSQIRKRKIPGQKKVNDHKTKLSFRFVQNWQHSHPNQRLYANNEHRLD